MECKVLKIALLIHKKAPFSHKNVYDALVECFQKTNNDLVIKTCEDYMLNPEKVDWIFLLDHYQIRQCYTNFKLKYKSKVAIWILEDTYEIDATNKDLNVDIVFTNDAGSMRTRMYSNQNVILLPLACRKSIFFPDRQETKQELIFVGNAFLNRIHLVHDLKDFLEDQKITLHIYGINWEKAKFNSSYIVINNMIISEQHLAYLYNTTETALEINRGLHNQNINKVPAITPGRGFNSLGCACHTITDRRDTSSEYFPDDCISYCDNIEDIKRQIYLNKFKKKEIAEKGQLIVHQKHTFEHRVEKILKEIS
jgi:spore maturation protein CgeB